MKRKLLLLLFALYTSSLVFGQLSEDFDGSSFPPTGWTAVSGSGAWDQSSQVADHTTGTASFARYDCYNISGATAAELITPTLDVTTGDKTFSFWANYYLVSGTWGSAAELYVDVTADDGNTWTQGTTNYIAGQEGNGWLQTSIDLGNYEGQNFVGSSVKVRFRAISDYGSYDIGIDDVLGPALYVPACPAPTNQVETNKTTTSVDLGWTEAGSATLWDIEWGSAGFTQGTGTTITGVTANPYTLSGLTAGTSYEWYVRSDCGGGSTSTWTGPHGFETLPGSHPFPLTENFESGFTYFNNAPNNTNDFVDETTLFHGGAHSVHNAYTPSNSDILHETGVLDLSTTTHALLEFWQIAKTEGSFDKCYIEISTDGGSTYTALPGTTYQGSGSGYASAGYFDEDDYTTWGTGTEIPDNTWWKKETFDLSAYNTTNVRIRFRLTSDGSVQKDGWYLDDISVYEPSCPDPSAQGEDSLKLNSAQLRWTENGSASNWDIRIGVTGFDTTGASFSSVTNDTITVDTLLASTTYQWYVRASCGGSDFSNWVGPHSFTTTTGKATGPYPADGTSGVLVSSDTLEWNPVAGITKYVLNIGTSSGGNDVLSDYSTTDTLYKRGTNWDYHTPYFWTVNTVYNGTSDTVTGTEWDFTTECGTYTPEYNQGFAAYLPICWTEATGYLKNPTTLTGASSSWTQDDFANVSANGKSAKLNIYGTTKKEWLISPSIDLSGGSYQLEFDLALTHYGNTNSDTLGPDDTLAVVISTDNGTTWNLSDTLQIWTYPEYISNTGEHITIDLSSYSTTVKIGFYGSSTVLNKDNDVFIDNFKVRVPPACPEPTSLSQDNIKLNSVKLHWKESGSATTWNVRIGTTGFDTTGAAYYTVVADTFLTVDTLLASTSYEWYVRASCGAGSNSVWVKSPASFNTLDGVVTGPYPADGATRVLISADTLEWNPVDNATKYVLNIGTTAGGNNVLADYGLTDTIYIKGANWDYSTQYYWTVNIVYNGTSDTVAGTEWEFNTECNATTPPYFQAFDDVTAPDFPFCMTVENTNGDAYEWTTYASGLSAPNAARITYNYNAAMDDWFFTQGLNLSKGVTYEVSFVYRAASASYPEKLAVDWGNDALSTAMSGTPIFDNPNVTNTSWFIGTGTITPTTTGVYYVGFHGYSDANMWNLYIDDIKVVEQVATSSWQGTSDSDWDNPANWNPGIPSSNTIVTIPTGLSHYPTVSMASSIDSLIIESDASGDASILNDGLLIVSGGARIQRYLTSGVWHDFSPSAQNQTLDALYFGGSPDVWLTHYNEPDNSRTYLTSTTDTMDVGAGFEIWVGGSSAVTANFIGSMNRSDVALSTASSPALSYTGADPLGYNLIGNPFASPIALDSGNWGMANVDSAFWVLNGTTYKDYNTLSHLGSLSGGIIPMGQGFFIHANAASPAITIPMAARVHSAQSYYKNGRASSSDVSSMSLRAMYANNEFDELNIAFIPGASDLFEGYDTRKMLAFNGEAPQVYALIPDEELSLNSLPVLSQGEQKTVKVAYKPGINGVQTLVADISNLYETEVMLEDLKLNKIQDLNLNPVYTFDAVTYQNPDRFRLHFNRSVTGVNEEDAASNMRTYAFNSTLFIASNGELVNQTKQLTVFDILGRKIIDKTIPPGDLISVPVNTSDAYVVVRVISNGEVYTTKVFIK